MLRFGAASTASWPRGVSSLRVWGRHRGGCGRGGRFLGQAEEKMVVGAVRLSVGSRGSMT